MAQSQETPLVETDSSNPKDTDKSKEKVDSNATKELPPKAKKRKAMAPRAKCWNHFTKKENADGTVTAACNYCGKEYFSHSKGNGTTAMNHHMTMCKLHPHRVETDQAQAQLVLKQGTLHGTSSTVSSWRFDQKEAIYALAFMIIVDELPFSFVEKEGFKRFIAVICPRFKIPSRWTIQRHIYQMYLDEKLKLRQLFERGQRICITTDTWTSIQRINYMCITGHFIDGDWSLNKRILNFCPISSHKGEEIGKEIEACLYAWGIKRVFTVTVDNAASNDVAIDYLKGKLIHWEACVAKCKYMHMRCLAHILNLIVTDGLKCSSKVVLKVRNYVRYIRQSPARLSRFRQCVKMEHIDCKKSLCLDVPTRWNSTYLMLSTAANFERAFERYDESMDPYFKFNMLELGGFLDSNDWEEVRALSDVLKHFYYATLRISGSSYVTCNTLWTKIVYLRSAIVDLMSNSGNDVYKSMGEKMKLKFDKYWGNPENMNKLIYMSTIFYPREKAEVLECVLIDFYGQAQGSTLFVMMKSELSNMFSEYKARIQPEKTVDSSEPSAHVDDFKVDSSNPRPLLRDKYKKARFGDSSSKKKTELEYYLNEELVDDGKDFDVLRWWKLHSERFPVLSEMARDVLVVPVSTVSSESAFSTGGRVLDAFRSSLTPEIVESLVCTQDWLRQSFNSLSIEENLDELEEFEKELDVNNENGSGTASTVSTVSTASTMMAS